MWKDEKHAYTDIFQDLIAPAQYWHDPLQEQEFTDISKYLAIINNQQDVMNETIKNNFLNLKNFVMILWKDDTFIIPKVYQFWHALCTIISIKSKESSHFGYYMTNQTEIVEPFEETDLFREDWIGLKQMETDGKVHLLSMDGDHMDFDSDWFHDNVVTKFLLWRSINFSFNFRVFKLFLPSQYTHTDMYLTRVMAISYVEFLTNELTKMFLKLFSKYLKSLCHTAVQMWPSHIRPCVRQLAASGSL